jgi:hypothetical protein
MTPRILLVSAILATAAPITLAVALPATPTTTNAATNAASNATTNAATVDVPVRAVVLYSSGVGYFEHLGSVTGNGVAQLSFTSAQINDVLKSLVLQDLGGGTISAVTYASQDPLAKILARFGVDLSSNPSLADLLYQLRGERVTVSLGGETVHGTILGIEVRKKLVPGGASQVIDQPLMNLLTDGALRAVSLDDVTSLTLDDPHVQQQLTAALAALAGSRDKDKRPVTIHFTGAGERRVRIGYVAEAPVWRASYRLILDQPAAAHPGAATPADTTSADLQGWAIVQNPTDTPWDHVRLSLVSGRPISFTEDLDQPLYLPRPQVQPQQYAGLLPPMDQNGMAPAVADRMRSQSDNQLSDRAAQASKFDAAGEAGAPGFLAGANGSTAPIDPTASIAALARGTSLGELFQYTVPDVSLPPHQACMLPIITNSIDAQRVSVYNLAVLPRNPLNGALLRNNTGKHLLAGPVTVIDGSAYAGDAQLDNLPPGQQRLISYGIDLQMAVDAADNHQESSIVGGKIVHGMLTVDTRTIDTQKYIARNSAARDKTLVIEHPRRGGDWALVNTPAPMESTDAVHRFLLPVPADGQAMLTVAEQTTTSQEIALLPADVDSFAIYLSTGSIPKPVAAALAQVVQMKQDRAQTQQQIEQAKQTLNGITQEQSRIRDDLRIASTSSGYRSRLMKKLDDQETQIEQTQAQQADLEKKLTGQQQALATYLDGLTIG